MKQKKREYLILYSYYDRAGIAEHLEEMASKGWMLERIGSGGWQYRRMEPRRLRFSVAYFPKATRFDPSPSEQLETFRDLCAEAGWILVADSAQMQVFYNEDPDAVPIETDPAVQLTNLHKAMKRSFLLNYWVLLALSLFEVALSAQQLWTDPIDRLSSPANLLSGVAYLPLLLLVVTELTRYYRWLLRAKAAVKTGDPLPELRSARTFNLLVVILAVAELLLMLTSSFSSPGMTVTLFLMLLCMAAMFLLTYAATAAMKRLKFSARANRVITFVMIAALSVGMVVGLTSLVFRGIHSGWLADREPAETYEAYGITWEVYHDDIPLRIEELMEIDYNRWSTEARQSSSFLLGHMEYTQQARLDAPQDIPDLEYEIVDVKTAFLYDLCKQDFINWAERWNDELPQEYRNEYRPVDASLWDAEEVYQYYFSGEPSNQFLICWPDRLVEIHFYWEPTPAQIAIAAEKLQNA